jgi:sulfur relay (sulfurtransferase) DsrF/TusC family protein
MSTRILNVITCGYRATLEEQDDTILWLTRAMRGANAAIDVLLWGNAVSYAVRAQDSTGLAFGERRQTQPPRLADDTAALHYGGAKVFYSATDARERGIATAELIEGVIPLEPTGVPELFARYDRILWW